MDELTFFTGFPGSSDAVSSPALLAADPELRLAALVEPGVAEEARPPPRDRPRDRIEVLEGDIGRSRLGARRRDYERLRPR